MTFFGRLAIAMTAVLALTFGPAHAAKITFTHQSSGAGTLDGMTFGPSPFTITAMGDTSDRMNQGPGVFFIDHMTASIEIDGLGTFDFVTGTRTFLNANLRTVGFSRAGAMGADLVNGPEGDAAFTTWDMLSSIGPVSGSGRLLQWANTPVVTSGGVLVFDSGRMDVQFQAVVQDAVIPLPAAAPLLLAGLAALGLAGRRRKN